MKSVYKIFISSTFKDLEKEREAIEQALQKLNETIPIDMKYFGSRPNTPLEESLKEVENADIYLGIFAYRYGTIPDGQDYSITELEYCKAKELNKPRLIYLSKIPWGETPAAHVETEKNRQEKLEQFKTKLEKDSVFFKYSDARELALQVVIDIRNLVAAEIPGEVSESPYGLLRMYLEACRNEHRWLQILGLDREIEIDRIYIHLQLSQKYRDAQMEECIRSLAGEELEKSKDVREQPVMDIHQATSRFGRLVIIGDPGSGKTTSLRHMVYSQACLNLERLKSNQEPEKIPVYIPLGILGDPDKSIADYIWDVVKYYSLPLSLAENLERYLRAGQLLLLVDGIDEVHEEKRTQVLRIFAGLLKLYPRLPVIFCSRKIGYEHTLPGTVLEILPLSEILINGFIASWFKSLNQEQRCHGAQLIQQVKDNRRIYELAQNPFLLSIICLICEKGRTLPKNRIELYELCVRTLLVLWDEEKGIKRNRVVYTYKEDVLMVLALYFYKQKEWSMFPIREVHEKVNEYIKGAGLEYKAADLLDEIEYNSGLLRKISYRHYAFAHRTLYEYFVARALVMDNKNHQRLLEFVEKYYRDSQWVEIFRLGSGMLDDPNVFLEKVFDLDVTLGARCYLDARSEQVDHGLIRKRWTERIVREERIKIVSGIQSVIEDKQQVLDFIEVIFRAGESDTEVLYQCDQVLIDLKTVEAEALRSKIFDWWPEERRFSFHKDYFAKSNFWDFAGIKAGRFAMGGNEYADEKPIHEVSLSEFNLGRYPITVGQYDRFDPEHRKKYGQEYRRFFKNNNQPVIMVNWYDAYIFCKWAGGRLPTEAEWEYACRAGTKTKYYWGDKFDEIEVYAWWQENSKSCTHPVGKKNPNDWELFDMIGNVWEWCQDWYGKNYYKENPERNPTGPAGGSLRVYRGGCWWNGNPALLRSAYRSRYVPAFRFDSVSFRLVRTVTSPCSS